MKLLASNLMGRVENLSQIGLILTFLLNFFSRQIRSLTLLHQFITCASLDDPNNPTQSRKFEHLIDTAKNILCNITVIQLLIATGIIHLILITLYGIVSINNFMARRWERSENKVPLTEEIVLHA
jgi:hypothetical protein